MEKNDFHTDMAVNGGLYLLNRLGTSVQSEVWPVRLPEPGKARDFLIKPNLCWNTVGNWSGRMINDLNRSDAERYFIRTYKDAGCPVGQIKLHNILRQPW